jgi:hypothetical protein
MGLFVGVTCSWIDIALTSSSWCHNDGKDKFAAVFLGLKVCGLDLLMDKECTSEAQRKINIQSLRRKLSRVLRKERVVAPRITN